MAAAITLYARECRPQIQSFVCAVTAQVLRQALDNVRQKWTVSVLLCYLVMTELVRTLETLLT